MALQGKTKELLSEAFKQTIYSDLDPCWKDFELRGSHCYSIHPGMVVDHQLHL